MMMKYCVGHSLIAIVLVAVEGWHPGRYGWSIYYMIGVNLCFAVARFLEAWMKAPK